ncbi:hypothetical protein [Glutamicibacter sp. M10]|uniref:hypothetical protein n=1 Tax=Glutamicibacter sp. M10 TaxID=3023076 RepID=UPI0021C59690|nr:hypothetical protein [Glutamicibacter sp. M10]UXN31284.1 hypothetical protein N6V40_12955 [Glutamicibacter sp. M10]
MIEQYFKYKETVVPYMERPATRDTRSLLIVFSGIVEDCGYEFIGKSVDSISSNILWIRDKFDGQSTYYMCQQMDFSISDAVQSLILEHCHKLGIKQEDCTLFGISKGGAGALYIGLKYGYKNIIASVPQLAVGDYIHETRPLILSHMTRTESMKEDVEQLNSLIPNLVSEDEHIDRNIYVFSSESDNEYRSQIKPFVDSFRKYANFNTIISSSKLITGHTEVTRYNIGLIISLINFAAEGVYPRLGDVRTGGQSYASKRELREEPQEIDFGNPVCEMDKSLLKGSVWYPEGAAFIRGHAVEKHADISRTLIFKSGQETSEVALGGCMNRRLNAKYYGTKFRDYSYSGFASRGHDGIPLSSLKPGKYDVQLKISNREIAKLVPLTSRREIDSATVFDGFFVRVLSNPRGTNIYKKEIAVTEGGMQEFELATSWIKGDLFHLEGRFAVRGLFGDTIHKNRYFVTLKSSDQTKSYRLGNGRRKQQINLFGDPFTNYTYSYYATEGYSGVDISDLNDGSFDVFVTVITSGIETTKRLPIVVSKSIGTAVIVTR